MRTIDLNADLGEGMGDDEAILAVVTSASIACGGHAGDAGSMALAARRCREAGVALGAHPSYPDREGFGRRRLDIPADALRVDLLRQVRDLAAAAEGAGVGLTHLKAHGALYNLAMVDDDAAHLVLEVAGTALERTLPVYALPGSRMASLAADHGIAVVPEAFADRAATAAGTLVPRTEPGAVLTDPEAVRERMGHLDPRARTVCVHGDSPAALDLARAARRGLLDAGFTLAPATPAADPR